MMMLWKCSMSNVLPIMTEPMKKTGVIEMAAQDPKMRAIEKIIRRGEVRHDRIEPALEEAGLLHVNSDDISELVH